LVVRPYDQAPVARIAHRGQSRGKLLSRRVMGTLHRESPGTIKKYCTCVLAHFVIEKIFGHASHKKTITALFISHPFIHPVY
jgi:hypothetical protein